jgi:hypothetical protein
MRRRDFLKLIAVSPLVGLLPEEKAKEIMPFHLCRWRTSGRLYPEYAECFCGYTIKLTMFLMDDKEVIHCPQCKIPIQLHIKNTYEWVKIE